VESRSGNTRLSRTRSAGPTGEKVVIEPEEIEQPAGALGEALSENG